MNRTRNSAINTAVVIGSQIILMLVGFVSRSFFIRTLSIQYLGINGLFSNILSMLSLIELGLGTAITYSLYSPIAEKNENKIRALMWFYKKAYIFMGLVIIILGLSITPFLRYFIKEVPEITNLSKYFIVYVVNTAFSYFYSYKRTLIIANQKSYITTLYHDVFYISQNILQIIALLLTHDYFLFLVIQLCFTIFENIAISFKADRMYPYLRKPGHIMLEKETLSEIKKNTSAMVLHKIGSVIVRGTDNLLFSKFIGIAIVGLYSNYMLITNSLNIMFGMIFQAITASVGNLGATETEDKSEFVFNSINFMGFWIYSFASISLICLLSPFIYLWLGEEFIFTTQLEFFIVLNFYLTGMRKSVLTFRDALGLYWYDRYKPLLESIINLIISIVFVLKFGAVGVLIGTTISTLLTSFWIEPYVLYKYGFKSSAIPYFSRYFIYTIVMLLAAMITIYISSFVPEFTFSGLLIKILICAVTPNIIFLTIFYKTKEFKYLFNSALSLFNIKL